MPSRDELQRNKRAMMQDALANLSKPETKVLVGLLELEDENRHLHRPRVKEPLKQLVESEVRDDSPVD